MWLIAQQAKPDDYVVATGETHTVREFVELAFAETGRKIAWQDAGTQEHGVDAKSGQVLVSIDPRYFRPTEVDYLHGDPATAQPKLDSKHTPTFPLLLPHILASH